MTTATYLVTVDGEGKQGSRPSLFEACLAARAHGNGANVVSPEGRLVAFFCGWRKRIAPAFGAHRYERDQIGADFGFEAL